MQTIAREAGLPVELAATLLIEAELVRESLASLGVAVPDGAAGGPPVALSAAEADYLRALTVGRRLARSFGNLGDVPVVFPLPVRLVARARPEVIAAAVEGDLEQALAWEVGAVRAGMMMGEWVSWAALAARLPEFDPSRG